MNISKEEKLMYSVMKVIYDSGILMNFKGSMVLKACLLEAEFTEKIRHTLGIDANWYFDNEPSADQMISDILMKSFVFLRMWISRHLMMYIVV